jgi:hypothetical protein
VRSRLSLVRCTKLRSPSCGSVIPEFSQTDERVTAGEAHLSGRGVPVRAALSTMVSVRMGSERLRC